MWQTVSKTAEGGKRSLVTLVRAVPEELKERIRNLQRLTLSTHLTCVGLKANFFDKLKLKQGYILQKKRKEKTTSVTERRRNMKEGMRIGLMKNRQ